MFMERVQGVCGGPEGVERLFHPGAGDRTRNSFTKLARSLLSIEVLYRLFIRWGVPRHLGAVRSVVSNWRPGVGLVTLTIDADRAGSAPTFRFILGVLRNLPRLHHLPPAVVTSTIDDRQGVFEINYPQSGSFLGRLPWAVDTLRGNIAAVDELADQAEEISSQHAQLTAQVAELRRIERELREHQEWLAIALDAATVGVWSVDLATRASTVSPGFRQLTGLTGEDPVGELRDRVHPDDRPVLDQANAVALREKTAFDLEYRYQHPDGRLLWLNGKGRITWDAKGRPERVTGSVSDISERKAFDEQLRLADRLISAGTLAAGVAHEINNPLTYILGNLDILRSGLTEPTRRDSAELLALLGDMETGLWRIRDVVKDLRTFSRPPEDVTGPVDVRTVCATALRMVEHEIRHITAVEFAWDDASLRVIGNEMRLGQVFINLLVNAAHAMPPRPVEANRVLLRGARGPDDTIVVDVVDNGTGVAPENLPRLFDPFFTTKPVGVGTGLGLSVCRGIVAATGGSIRVESTLGVGTTFSLSFPAAMPSVDAEVPLRPTATPRLRGRVLVVDDEPLVRRAIARTLSTRGLTVTEAEDGQVALDLLLGGETFDVVLCDLMMPRLTGMDVHRILCDRLPALGERMYFITGGAPTAAAQEFLASLPDRLIEKPIDSSRLFAVVTRHLP